MGVLLGKIHLAGSKSILEPLTRKIYKEKPKEDEFAKLTQYKASILAKEEQDTINAEFLEYIQLKLDLIPELDMEPVLESNTLVHGDYQTGNLLFDQRTREIIGVCDWEKAEMEPRAHELGRAILYISFGGDYIEEEGIESARQILEGYNSIFPISNEELIAGFKVRLRRMVLTSWLENHYYDLGDARGNHFVSHEARLIKDFLQGDMLGKLIA
jgi:Ser/Thr protein kinase RdoA (MazF antagonist)